MKPSGMTAPLFFPALAALAFSFAAHAGEAYRVEGVLKERGTRKPLAGVNVFAIPAPPGSPALRATTDAQGRFSIEGVPAGDFKWIVNFTGFDRLERYDEQPEGSRLPIPPRELYLEKSTYLAYETTIYDKAQKRDDKTRSITRDQISKLAGASNDPVKAVQNLPGVNRTSGFSSQVIIEGSSPNDTRYQVDGQEVPGIFHFGGLTTIVPPEAVERVDLLVSGFGVEYGRTTAGLVGVQLKAPAADRLRGMGFVDIFNMGAVLEGPVGASSSFFLSARQSYIGAVLKAALKDNDDFNLTVAPDFRDVTGILQSEITPIDTVRLVALGSMDQLEFVLTEPVRSDPELRGDFSTQTSFFRLIPEWTHRHSARATTRASFGIGKNWIRLDTEENFFHLQAWQLTARGEHDLQATSHWRATIGMDHSFTWADVDLALPKIFSAGGVGTPFSVAETRSVSVRQDYSQIGAYWRNEIRLGETPWTVLPSLRVDHYDQTRETVPEPRAQVRYRVDDSLTLRAAGGYYSQAPQPQETDPTYGNPAVRAIRATHASIGAEKDLRGGASRGWNVGGDLFYKHFYNLVTPSFAQVPGPDGAVVPENYTNQGKGRAFGLAAQARYDYRPFSGWLSYTLSRTTRWNPSDPEYVAGFDQTHNLAAIGSVELPRNWQVSARFRFVTGNPFTPIAGATLDADNDIYIPTRGEFFSQRVSPFWQLDVRIDKKWIFDRWILSAYLDVQNVTNHANIEAVRYSYDYARQADVQGLPFLPIFGLKGEF